MASGTVYPAKVALKALLEAWDWPVSAPVVQWGAPVNDSEVQIESVYFTGTEITDDFRILGATRSDETYNLSVAVDVRQYGDTEQVNEQRAWVLHDELLTLLRVNMTLSGAINRITGYRVRQGNPVPGDGQWHTLILIDVACVGFVTY